MDILQESPSRVLRRVNAYDDIELPSLPNFSQDLDFDTEETDDYYGGGGSEQVTHEDDEDELSTPHVARYRSPPRTGSTIVPRQRTPIDEPTPLSRRDPRDLSSDGFTSTPYTEQLRLSSSRRSLSHSTDSKQSRQPTTAYSDHWESDASSQRLPVPEVTDLVDPSLPTAESFDGSVMDTPMPRAYAKKSPVVAPCAVAPDSRIPSLSRSEQSGTSHEATTPDQPQRFLEQLEEPTNDYPTHEYNTSIASVTPPSESEQHLSPLKNDATPAAIRYMDVPTTAARAAATPFNNAAQKGPLRDVTTAFRNRETTPSPGGTPVSEYATPRANASDLAERRKSHVLTVLQTSKLPSRFKVRATPHPSRRVSHIPDASSILEEGDTLATSNADQSFVSIASSQDLTIDRRGSRYHHRGNTSVPNIVLGTGTAASPGGPENRAEFVKIGKHTNMMNNALHEENAKLAQEVQDWQNEYTWLMDTLKASGVEVTDEGQVILPVSLNDSTASTASQRKARFDDLEAKIRKKDELVATLEKKVEAGEEEITALVKERDEAVAAHEQLQAEFAKKTQDHVHQFTDICQDYEKQLTDLKTERDAAKDEVRHLQDEAADLQAEIKQLQGATASSDEVESLKSKVSRLETELEHAREDADAADAETDKMREHLTDLEHERDDLHEQLQTAREQADRLRDELEDVHRDEDEQVASLKARVTEKEEDKKDALAALETVNARVADLQQLLADKEDEIRTQQDTIVDLEQQIAHRAEDEAALRHDIADLEADLKTARGIVADKEADIATLQTALEVAEMVNNKTLDNANASAMQTLQDRLDDAHHEIERLKKELGDAPERQWAIESREARIKSLETEKEALQERLRTKNFASPMRSMVTSTPIVNRVLANLRTPKTPGPMKELSWLQTTIGDSNESILRAQLEHLQQELEAANSQLDKNFNRIEAAGLDSVSLAEKLVRAQDRIAELEEHLRQLARDNKQSLVSLNLGQNKNERLENALDAVHEQMSRLKADTEAEKDRLKEESRRLRTALRDLQNQAEQEIEDLGAQIVEIRREADDKVVEVEEQLQTLRAEKETLNTNLKAARVTIGRLETDIRELQQANTDAKRENRQLQDTAANAARNQEMLRSLQDKLREAQVDADKLRDTLRERNRSLEGAENHIQTLKAERERITRELLTFGDDLSAQRRECAKFGMELDALRQTSNHKAAQAKNEITQLESDLRWTRERLETATRQAKAAEREYGEVEARALAAERRARDLEQKAAEAQNRGATAANDAADQMRAKYKIQMRRLAAQIEYLKALYARENTYRNALALQKKFLLVLVGGMSLNEQATLRAIASMGFPVPPPPRPHRTLKAVAIAVVATIRARRMADEWRSTRESRSTLTRR